MCVCVCVCVTACAPVYVCVFLYLEVGAMSVCLKNLTCDCVCVCVSECVREWRTGSGVVTWGSPGWDVSVWGFALCGCVHKECVWCVCVCVCVCVCGGGVSLSVCLNVQLWL